MTKIDAYDWKELYKKRIMRVLIPYVIWTFLYTTVNFFENGINIKKYIINLLTARATGVFYYIFIYIQFVILTPFLCKLAKSRYRYLGFVVAPISVLIKYIEFFSDVAPNKYILGIYDICCLGWVTYFYLGLLLGNGIIKKHYNIWVLLIIYVLSVLLQTIEGYIWFKHGIRNYNCLLF